MTDLVGKVTGNRADLDVQHVLVIDLEDLRNQPGADRVGLAGVPIHFHSHRMPPLPQDPPPH